MIGHVKDKHGWVKNCEESDDLLEISEPRALDWGPAIHSDPPTVSRHRCRLTLNLQCERCADDVRDDVRDPNAPLYHASRAWSQSIGAG